MDEEECAKYFNYLATPKYRHTTSDLIKSEPCSAISITRHSWENAALMWLEHNRVPYYLTGLAIYVRSTDALIFKLACSGKFPFLIYGCNVK